MTASSHGRDSVSAACSPYIIWAALFALPLLAAGMPSDAGAKDKAEQAAAAETKSQKTKSKPGAHAGQASQKTGAVPAKADQPAQDGGKPPATSGSEAEGGAKPDAGVQPAAEAAPKPPAWSEAEIADARAHCAVVLQRIQAIVLPHEPIKDGACGAPAPIELISIGENPRVTLSPPAVVTCDLAEALAGWMERDVQPLARKHLKSEIVKIETMSSYSCRNAYGRKKARLSEHGLANALDIGGFVTSSKKTADVLDDWGKPQRVIIAEQEAEKRAADAAAAKLAEAGLAANPMPAVLPLALPSTTGAAAAELARSTIIEGVPDAATAELVSAPASNAQTKLGGPVLKPAKKRAAELKAAAAPPPQPVGPAERTFLREAHKSACRIFGTTLGPEANEAHLNHFHLDMAERKFTKICD